MALVMVLIGAYNAIARYLGRFIGVNLSSNLYLELQWYLFSLIFLLGAGFALRENAHVRVDVLYGRLRAGARAAINVVGAVVMLLPFSIFVLWVSWPSIRNSWAVREASPDPGGLPRYPLKAVIIVAFVLLLAQGVSEFLKDVAVLRRGDDAEEEGEEGAEAPAGGIGL
ncbi:MAG: TRAP transporter small permease subunit [Gemmatimonadetes bacterium]|nr:TRAP transporter small permease subunit [Gemmatimonadota bacterium]MYC92739.1 TRAP transporter small permease subunit [Gemmatimonadota bacterium]MYG36638.1 TRAP transporter small permease subunit [Gemmatimonadota bacterium]